MTERLFRQENGFLYVEVLIGLVLLGIGLLAIVPMFVLAAHANASAGDQTFSAQLAEEKAEAFRILNYAALTAGSGQDYIVMRNIRYLRSWVIEQNTPHPGMKKVTIKVQALRESGYGAKRLARVSFYRVQ